jgi:hypothetical protein
VIALAVQEPDGWGLWMVWTAEEGYHQLPFFRPHVVAIFKLSNLEFGGICSVPTGINERMLARVSRVIEKGWVDSIEEQVYLFIPGRWFLKQWLINLFRGKFRRSLWSILSQFKIRTLSPR